MATPEKTLTPDEASRKTRRPDYTERYGLHGAENNPYKAPQGPPREGGVRARGLASRDAQDRPRRRGQCGRRLL